MRPYNPALNRKRVAEAMFMLQGPLADEDRVNYEDFVVEMMGMTWARYNGALGEQLQNEARDTGLRHRDFDTMALNHDLDIEEAPGLEYYELMDEERDEVFRLDGELWAENKHSYTRLSPFQIALEVGAGLKYD